MVSFYLVRIVRVRVLTLAPHLVSIGNGVLVALLLYRWQSLWLFVVGDLGSLLLLLCFLKTLDVL